MNAVLLILLASPKTAFLVPLILNGGTGSTSETIVDTIIGQVEKVVALMINVMTNLLANPFFAFLFACGFVRIGMSLIRKAKKASR